MKNILILGAGRSGTSMLAGTFSEAGYHMGEKLYPPRDTNPKGFFESGEINQLNEDILKYNRKRTFWDYLHKGYNRRLKKSQRWLCDYPPKRRFTDTPELRQRIQAETDKAPFCYKDPRFTYTYPLWARHCGDHVCLVIYRHPAKTIESMMKEISTQPYLKGVEHHSKRLSSVWANQYAQILSIADERFIFIHYEQLFEQTTLDQLSAFTARPELTNFSDRKLVRSKGANINPSNRCFAVYEQLNNRSGYTQ